MDFTKLKENLEKNGFTVTVFEDRASAAAYLNREIDHKTVGMGGSVTLDELGLYESLSTHNAVYNHGKEPENREEVLKNAASADIYLSSLNGIAETGELINIDGNGNRVSAIQFGHQKVYLVAGSNKVEATYEKALWRARNIAAPLNAKRLKRNTPCGILGDRCYDCTAKERICRGLSVLWKKPTGCDYEIVLIDEALGF